MIDLSVVIPVYKTEKYIRECVDSVLREAPPNSEIILVDDGSPDNCPQICDAYARKDERVHVIHQPNRGVSGARNAALDVVQGKQIFFIDSDDYIPKGYFAMLLQYDADLIIGNYRAFYEDGTKDIIGKPHSEKYADLTAYLLDFHYHFATFFNFAWGKIYQRDIIERLYLRFSEGVSMVEDLLFNLEYYRECSSITMCGEAQLQYRQLQGSLSRKMSLQVFDWYVQGNTKIQALLTEKNAFTKENETHFYTHFLGNAIECLIGYSKQSEEGRREKYAEISRNALLQSALPYAKNKRTRKIVDALKRQDVFRVEKAVNNYLFWINVRKKIRSFFVSIFTKIRNRTKWLLSFPKDWIGRMVYPAPTVKSIEETIEKVVKDKCSVARYGDGEFNIMFGNAIDFQQYDERLSQKMKDILQLNDEKFLVCLAGELYEKDKNATPQAKQYWRRFIRMHRWEIGKLLKKNKVYYHSSMTRFYMNFIDKTNSYRYAEMLKKIWDGRDIAFVEGEKSRLGVGNDFFDNAKSIKRILCPANQAFACYDEILKILENNIDKETLVLIALGPTATAMAYDAYLMGYQAIDIGHIDIEYEWMRMGATTKVAVKDKYVNECEDGKSIGDIADDAYKSQIIAKVGLDAQEVL